MKVKMLMATKANMESAVKEMESVYNNFLITNPSIKILGENMQFVSSAGEIYGVISIRFE
jgi:hypothetical protein